MSWRAVKWAVNVAQAARLTTTQRLVLMMLAVHHNDRAGICCPSVETLAAETGLSRRGVQIATAALADARVITISSRLKHGIQTTNQYDLFGPIKGRTTCAPGGRMKRHTGGAPRAPKYKDSTRAPEENVLPFPPRAAGDERNTP